MKNNKITEVMGPTVITLYEGLSHKEMKALIEEHLQRDVQDKDSIDNKKIKKGSFEKSFFRGSSKCTLIKKYK